MVMVLACATHMHGAVMSRAAPFDARDTPGTLILCEPTMAAREATAARVAAETGATFVPPYDSATVIAGQGTLGLELLQQVPQLDAM